MKLKVYVAGSMSGLTWDQLDDRFLKVAATLKSYGFMVFNPLMGKDYMKDIIKKHAKLD